VQVLLGILELEVGHLNSTEHVNKWYETGSPSWSTGLI